MTLTIHSNKKIILKNKSQISKIKTDIYPFIKVSKINLAVESKIIIKIQLSNHLKPISFMHQILKPLVCGIK